MAPLLSIPPSRSGDARPGTGRKIAFIKRGPFSFSNGRTSEQLHRVFPEDEIEAIDVVDEILRPQKWKVFLAVLHACRLYWRQILSRRLTVRGCFYRTPYIFRVIREGLQQRLSRTRDEYRFSIQTQSLFDGSLPGLPHFVYTDHTHLTNLYYPAFSRALLYDRSWIDLEQEIYGHAAHVFVMSEHVRRSLIEHYGIAPESATSILAGSNLETTPVPLQNDDYRNQTILFVGIDWERKGGPNLLRAFDLVLAKLPGARLIIVGCEPRVHHPQVEVMGRLERSEVRQHFVRASVFCLPTRIEPFGIAAVEAFCHRLPVVTTNLGAMATLVRDGESGRLVPPDDAPALAAALVELLADPEKCRRMAEAGHQSVHQNYTWDAAGGRLKAGISATLNALGA